MERNVEFAFGSGQWQCVGRRIAFMKLSKTVFEVSSLLLPPSIESKWSWKVEYALLVLACPLC